MHTKCPNLVLYQNIKISRSTLLQLHVHLEISQMDYSCTTCHHEWIKRKLLELFRTLKTEHLFVRYKKKIDYILCYFSLSFLSSCENSTSIQKLRYLYIQVYIRTPNISARCICMPDLNGKRLFSTFILLLKCLANDWWMCSFLIRIEGEVGCCGVRMKEGEIILLYIFLLAF